METQASERRAADGRDDAAPCVPHPAAGTPAFDELLGELEELREEMLRCEADGLRRAGELNPAFEASARNLLHYVALRCRDLRHLQEGLMELGLSSLGRAEAHALATVEAVIGVLRRLGGREAHAQRGRVMPDFAEGRALLDEHADALLGPPRPHRRVRVLVTLPSEAADDYALVHGLVERGMDCVRINCSHDDPAAWERMIFNLRRAEAAAGRRSPVLMDLSGPKLRTGPIEPGEAVVKIRPVRDELGRVTRPARVWLTSASAAIAPPAEADAILPIDGELLARLEPGDACRFSDARGSRRVVNVVQTSRGGAWAETARTCYVVPGTRLRLRGRGKKRAEGQVGALPAREGEIVLRVGDRLVLTASLEPGRAAELDEHGRLIEPARVGCTLPEVFADVRVGESIWFDDGRIGGVVRSAGRESLTLEVVSARRRGEKLRADKGINLPDSELHLPALTQKDAGDLQFVVRHADAVALSFVHQPEDVGELLARLRELGRPDLGVVLKIETRRAFEQLPHLLLAAMKSPCAGVMIARGDLAVECGWQRLAEVQEEILWLCEAAHIPVIWATQVLESLAKEGRPSRAEITDAAMGERAECVMLNKGPHVEAAVAVLDDILQRMQGHQRKKSAMLRPLQLAGRFRG